MIGLYPIIRRVRRPLLPAVAVADAAPEAAPVPVVQAAAVPSDTQPKRKDKRGKVASAQPAQ